MQTDMRGVRGLEIAGYLHGPGNKAGAEWAIQGAHDKVWGDVRHANQEVLHRARCVVWQVPHCEARRQEQLIRVAIQPSH